MENDNQQRVKSFYRILEEGVAKLPADVRGALYRPCAVDCVKDDVPEGAPQAIRRMRPRSRPAVYEIRPLGVFFCGHHRAGAGLRGRVSPVPLPAGRRRVRGLSGPLRMLPPEHPLCHGGAVARQGHPGGRARDRVVGRQRMPLPDHCRVAHCGAWLLQAASGARALGAGMVAAQNKKSRSQCFGIF